MTPVNANAGEYKSQQGFRDLYIAEVLQDDADAYVVDTPERLAPAATASIKHATNSETQYADDAPFDELVAEGASEIELEITNLPAEMDAKLNGQVFDAPSGRVYDSADPTSAPFFALGYRSKKTNGSYRYFWYYKTRFRKPDSDHASVSDKPEAKLTKLMCKALKTTYQFDQGTKTDGMKRLYGDEDTTNFDGATWFSQVQTPSTTTPAALALSSSTPTNGATGVVVSSNISLVFNNALVNGAQNNVTLLDASDAIVAVTATLSSDRKTITLNPDSNMAAANAHDVIVSGVKDIYGDTLSQVVSFTTA